MKNRTHSAINIDLCGTPVKIDKDYSLIRLDTTESMIVDNHGLIHGGFIFGVADYAAMLAVNHPNVVLGSASVEFLHPIKIGETMHAEANVTQTQDKKRTVSVLVRVRHKEVFKGLFTCFILKKHVLTE